MFKKLLLITSLLLMIGQSSWAETFKVDTTHSQVRFSIAHMVIFTVQGTFADFSGSFEADLKRKTLKSVEGIIQVKSINTSQPRRDAHLRSPDFFNADKYPEIKFKHTKITGSGDNITVVGNLTIRGVTNKITLKGKYLGQIKDPWGKIRAGFVAKGKLNRNDYGITWNKVLETGGVMVGKEVNVTIEIEAIKVN